MNPVSFNASNTCASSVGAFERNSKMFGPAAASAIGLAEAGAEAASTTVSLSQQALDGISDAASEVVSFVEDGYHAVGKLAADAYDEVQSLAQETVDAVGDAAEAVVDAVDSGVSTVAGYAMAGVNALRDVA